MSQDLWLRYAGIAAASDGELPSTGRHAKHGPPKPAPGPATSANAPCPREYEAARQSPDTADPECRQGRPPDGTRRAKREPLSKPPHLPFGDNTCRSGDETVACWGETCVATPVPLPAILPAAGSKNSSDTCFGSRDFFAVRVEKQVPHNSMQPRTGRTVGAERFKTVKSAQKACPVPNPRHPTTSA